MPEQFIQVPVSVINNLSARAMGLLLTFMERGENASLMEIMEAKPDGTRTLRAGLRELEEGGYLVRIYKRKGARLNGTSWRVNLYPEKSGGVQDEPEAA